MKPPSAAKGLRVAAVGILVAAYPFLVASGLDHLSARSLGAALLALLVAAALASGSHVGRVVPLLLRRFGLLVAVTVAAAATNHPVALKLLPTLTSLWLLGTFAASLRGGGSIVGQFASAMHDGFPDFLLPYCRKVTVLWCAFFAANGTVAALLAFSEPTGVWAMYTGFVSYLLVALLAAGEYVFHKSRFRFYEDGLLDAMWRRLCPPERTELGRRTLAWQLARSGGAPRDPR